MSNRQVDVVHYPVEEEDEMDDFEEIEDENQAGRELSTDTSAAQARKGKDIQAIPWYVSNLTRETCRMMRLEQYKNFEDIPQSGELIDNEYKPMQKGGNYYEFFHNTSLVKPTYSHHQLRDLVWATSKHDVYLTSHYSVMHWSSLSSNLSEVLNFEGHVAPNEKHAGNLFEGFTQTLITTLAVKDNFLVVGGIKGEIACKRLNKKGVCFCTWPTFYESKVTNSVEIYETPGGGTHFMVSNNDGGVREYDLEIFQLLNHFQFSWPVNHTSVSPDCKLVIIVGDDLDGMVVDSRDGKVVSSITGHRDYSFTSAWHPDGQTFATGSQDKTCRVWDIRNLTSPVTTLKGNIGAARSIRYSADGKFLVVAEPIDFVHIYCTETEYKKRQEIDFFGEISGVSLSPDDESLYIGIWDQTYSSLLQYNRKHNYRYLDSYI